MSATHFRFGADAVKSRSRTLRAGFLEGSTTVVVGLNRFRTLLLRPHSSRCQLFRGATGHLEPEPLIERFGDLPTAVDLA